jgi:hypothetical protein
VLETGQKDVDSKICAFHAMGFCVSLSCSMKGVEGFKVVFHFWG